MPLFDPEYVSKHEIDFPKNSRVRFQEDFVIEHPSERFISATVIAFMPDDHEEFYDCAMVRLDNGEIHVIPVDHLKKA